MTTETVTIIRLEKKLEWTFEEIQHKNDIISDLVDKNAELKLENQRLQSIDGDAHAL